jgi:predicted KAP-like P-loop ATPase
VGFYQIKNFTGRKQFPESKDKLFLTLYKINSKWIKGLDLRFETTTGKHKERIQRYRQQLSE